MAGMISALEAQSHRARFLNELADLLQKYDAGILPDSEGIRLSLLRGSPLGPGALKHADFRTSARDLGWVGARAMADAAGSPQRRPSAAEKQDAYYVNGNKDGITPV